MIFITGSRRYSHHFQVARSGPHLDLDGSAPLPGSSVPGLFWAHVSMIHRSWRGRFWKMGYPPVGIASWEIHKLNGCFWENHRSKTTSFHPHLTTGGHIAYVCICHISYIIYHISYIIYHISYIIYHISYIIYYIYRCHMS